MASLHPVGAMNRPLHCHPERSEGSVAMGVEMLRCAQHDSAVTQTNARINVLICIIWYLLEKAYADREISNFCAV
jgi:hypothetical protein